MVVAVVLGAVAPQAAGETPMSPKPFLDENEKRQLVELIHEAERGTRGEIVTVIAESSDGYRYIPLLIACLAALSVPGLYFIFDAIASAGWSVPESADRTLSRVYLVQGLVFLGLGSLFQLPALRVWLVPKAVKQGRAARHAREQFIRQGVHQTEARNGILIFVSVAEHYVEVLVDSGLSSRVNQAVWDETVADFVTRVKSGHVYEGFVSTIEHCRDVLWEHFPDENGRPNELPDHLIEV